MQDGGYVGLRPVDGEREAGNQDDDGLRIHGVDLLDELLLIQFDGFAVAAFAAIAGDRAGQRNAAALRGVVPVVPHVGTAGRVVAHHYHGHLGFARGVYRGIAHFVGGVVDGDVGTQFLLDALQRRDRIRRRAAIPIPVDGVGERANYGNGFE